MPRSIKSTIRNIGGQSTTHPDLGQVLKQAIYKSYELELELELKLGLACINQHHTAQIVLSKFRDDNCHVFTLAMCNFVH